MEVDERLAEVQADGAAPNVVEPVWIDGFTDVVVVARSSEGAEGRGLGAEHRRQCT